MVLADAETVAAVSAVFHTSPNYQKFYDIHGQSFEGFPDIYHLCAKMGMAFAAAECIVLPKWDGQWIDAIDEFVRAIYERAFNTSLSPSHVSIQQNRLYITDAELLQIAIDAINKFM